MPVWRRAPAAPAPRGGGAGAPPNHAPEKQEEKGRTFTRLTQLSEVERVEELSRMLSGQESQRSLLHAEEILKKAGEFKATNSLKEKK